MIMEMFWVAFYSYWMLLPVSNNLWAIANQKSPAVRPLVLALNTWMVMFCMHKMYVKRDVNKDNLITIHYLIKITFYHFGPTRFDGELYSSVSVNCALFHRPGYDSERIFSRLIKVLIYSFNKDSIFFIIGVHLKTKRCYFLIKQVR